MGILFYGDDGSRELEGDLSVGHHRLYGIATPVDPSGAISREYLDRRVATMASSQVPSGLICMWSGTTAPNAWKLCDGSNGTPDLRDRFIMGASSFVAGAAVATGGSSSHTLTLSEMPPHRHDMPGYSNRIGTGSKSEDDGFKGKEAEINVGKSEGDELKLQTEDTAGTTIVPGSSPLPNPLASPFSTVPPYYVLAFIMKV